MKQARFVLPMALALLASACAGLPGWYADCVAIGPRGRICLLPPAELPAVRARHVVTVKREDRSNTFLGRLHVDHDILRLAGDSLFGTHLFTVTWDGHGVVSRPADIDLHPDLVVALLEVALADPAVLRPHLHGLVLKVSDRGETEVRELFQHGRLVVRIQRRGTPLTAARLDISIPRAGFGLRLEPLTGAP